MSSLEEESSNKKIYVMFCITNIILNIDQGVLPAATVEMMTDLEMNKIEFGLLGSLMYIGLISGSLIAGFAYQKFPCKNVLLISMLLITICLSFFSFTKNIYVLGISRILTGFFQVFMVIFFPVWVDLFGREKKTVWLTILQIGVPVGTVLGYALTFLSIQMLSWKWGFWLQIILMFPCFIFILLCKESNLDTQRFPYTHIPDATNVEIIESVQSNIISRRRSSDNNALEYNYIQNLKIIFRSKIYLCSMLSISSLYFVVTGIQYWGTDYYRNVMDQDANIVYSTYITVTISGPTLGVLFGGYYVNRHGGYDSKNALKICVGFGCFAVFFAYPFTFIPIYFLAVAMMWMLLFFGGALMPILTGIMISSLPKKSRTFGNSAAQFFLNLFGFLPAPFVYGFICDYTGGRTSKWGMTVNMFWSIFGFIPVSIAYYIDKKRRKMEAPENLLTRALLNSGNEIYDLEAKKNEKSTHLEQVDAQINVNKNGLKKKNSFVAIGYTGLIFAQGNIPKFNFHRDKQQKINHSYECVSPKISSVVQISSRSRCLSTTEMNGEKAFQLK